MPPLQINHNCCYMCSDSLDDIFCQQCTCKSCGNGAHIGYNCPPKAPIISNPEQCNQTINELPQTLPSVHPTCNYEDENSFTYDSKPNSFNDSPSVLTHPPQLQFETYLCELCGNNAHYGYDCPPQFPLVYEQEPCYNQNFNDNYFPQNSQSSSQQYLCCENCGGPHATFQCQPMNEDYYEQNSCYDPNSFGFDQYQPPQFPVNYPPQETSREILQAREDLMETIQAFLKEKSTRKKETTAQSFIPYWNSSMIDDEKARDNFLKDVSISDNGLLRIDDVKSLKMCELSVKSVQNRLIVQVDLIPLFYFDDVDDEYTIIWRGIKLGITPDLVQIPSGSKGVSDDIYDHSDAESLLSQDIPITSPKIDFLSEEFAGEFAPIPPGMDEDKFDEEEVDYYDHDISSDDDSYENIEYPSQGGLNCVVISDNSNDPLLELPEFESFHFDFDPSFPRPPPEPSDVEISLIIETDAHVINDFGELNEDECFDPGGGENTVFKVDTSFHNCH
ncbi:hypothetical protein Tco_0677697 [Tanacetum coccineum]|uniref:CCHC-type domain-containing protein n=1 Tax=Tanacetum coccineum TaxID=301880 RepID=A0ABQ4XCZ2_9ASTR